MTIDFTTFRGQSLPVSKQSEIRKILRSLDDPRSYHCNLQLIYNNEEHFQTVPFRICNFEDLQKLAQAARSRSETITVQGDIHQNFHASGIVVNSSTLHKIPVYDTYIRVKYDHHTLHVLIYPPKIASQTPNYNYIVKVARTCTPPLFVIPPLL